jgi:ubiquitin-conjugating enzyme E2 variant
MRLLERLAIAVFALLWIALAVRSAGSLGVPEALAAILAGYLAADVASGLVHWFCDTCFAENTPLIGPLFIAPFREHHRDPLAMTRHSFAELNGNSALALIPVLVIALAQAWPPLLCPALASFALAVFATNQFHYWAHAAAAPRWVRWLQRRRLILAPAHHARHHRANFTGSYAITTGWTNLLLDRILR